MSLLAAALAAPVVCDPDAAERVLVDARIAPGRAPVIQPNLLPGLARREAGPEVRAAVEAICGDGTGLSLAPVERWESADHAAYSFALTRAIPDACAVTEQSVVLTVGVRPGAPLAWGIRARPPVAVTPLDGCAQGGASWRAESPIGREDGPIRLVLQRDVVDDETVAARVVVRRATPEGWREQTLVDPAPERLLDPAGSGPRISLTGAGESAWIVASGDREVDAAGCRARPGQTLWRWEGDAWAEERGRAALGLLARRGAWRLAGEDGWFLVLGQDTEDDRLLLEARARRLQRRSADPLWLLESASFPRMNAGFIVIAPDPWPTEAEADAARRAWGRRTGVYVRQAWSAADPCAGGP